MRYSRAGVVAVLLAAEVFLGGAILWALTGGHWAWPAQAAGLRHVSESGKTFAPIDAGNAPHVVIDDPGSRVVISASTDGEVHVIDGSRTVGWVWGKGNPALSVARTADGVSIRRGDAALDVIGVDFHRTEVALPPGSFVDVQRCGGATLSGLTGRVRVRSLDGHIEARDIRAGELALAAEDGSLQMQDVSAASIEATTSDGSIRASDLHVGGGRLQTQDGSVHVRLQGPDLRIHARTDDGTIRVDGRRVGQSGDSDGAKYRAGTGGGLLEVSTQDGSIHITTNGAV